MILDCKDLDEETKIKEQYYTPQPEAWGQPPASNYLFTIIDDVMYGQITGSSYLLIEQSIDFLLLEDQKPIELEDNGWLAFWDNEQDAIFDNL
jgi:hypothetical protein